MTLDEEIRDYLRDLTVIEGQRALREGETRSALTTLANQLQLVDRRIEIHATETRAALAGLDARLKIVEADVEDTGRHDLERLNRELAERKAQEQWWKRTMLTWAAAGVGAVVLGIGGCLLGALAHHIGIGGK